MTRQLAELFTVPYRTMVKRLRENCMIAEVDLTNFLIETEESLEKYKKRYCFSSQRADERVVMDNLIELAVNRLNALIAEGKVVLVNERGLDSKVRATYDAAYANLAKLMVDPTRTNKNKGEMCSLAYAKATGVPIFATDEKDLQPIIDKQLNHTYLVDITRRLRDFLVFLYLELLEI